MMTTTLLSFLGRVPRTEQGYRETRYDFGDGNLCEPAAFFGWPLQHRIKADRLVIMGTAGSMWDHLFEKDVPLAGDEVDAQMELIEAVHAKTVTAECLDPLQRPLAQFLGCDVQLEIIPYCRDEREQVALLSIMARHVTPGDTVHIDVTHGFRHLPMIALLAAIHLKTTRQATIEGIWYGAYDPDTGEAPVHNLAGLLRIAEWIEALHSYDKDGDYGAFAPLLGAKGEMLKNAAFFERTTNPVRARSELRSWAGLENRYPGNDSAAALFKDELEKRIAWHQRPDRASWERDLAKRYLQQADYVRAIIYGMESIISAEIQNRHGEVDDYENRDIAKDEMRNTREGFKTLSNLRNALTHGVRPWDRAIERALESEQGLRKTLRDLFRQLNVL
jgi:CRISPR-associated Csx2 family protein